MLKTGDLALKIKMDFITLLEEKIDTPKFMALVLVYLI